MSKIKDIKESNKEIITCMKFCKSFVWQENKRYFMYWIFTILINTFGPFINIIGTKYLINEIAYTENRDLHKVIFWVAFIVIGNFLYGVLGKIAGERQYYINDQLGRKMKTNVSERTVKMKFTHTENPETLEMIKKVDRGLDETNGVVGITGTISGIISNVLVLAGVTYLVFSCSYLLLIPIIISFVISYYVNERITKLHKEVFDNISDKYRVWGYFGEEVSNQRYAKDIRIYNADRLFLDKNIECGTDISDSLKDCDTRMWMSARKRVVIENLCTMVIYIIIGYKALIKQILIGEFSSLIQATIQFSRALDGILENYMDLTYTSHLFKHYIEFIDNMDYAVQKESDNKSKVPQDILEKPYIEFKNVSFKYPNTELYVLKNVNAVINTGEHLSIVGENGAGKTTFIKLLCRLYEVTEGEILINGRNINEFEYADYVKMLSVVFQDYRLLAFTVRENIALGKEGVDDNELMKLCEVGGIKEWIDSTEKKIDTVMYKQFEEDGIEPSGGQAQKLAIVRALYKNSPIVILDEPTAALDPISEYEIYKHFDSLVGGKTAVYISHRLSSCHFCDRIIVFNNGTIIENGTHDELLRIPDGFYANMYNTQAKHYL